MQDSNKNNTVDYRATQEAKIHKSDVIKAALLKSNLSNFVRDDSPRKVNKMQNKDQVNKIIRNNFFSEVAEDSNKGRVPFEDIGLTLATIRKKVPFE